MYVKINNNSVEVFPYSLSMFKRDNPNTSFPRNPSYETLERYNVFKVVEERPTLLEYQTLVIHTAEYMSIESIKESMRVAAKKDRISSIAAPIDGFEVSTTEDRENISGAIEFFETLSGTETHITWTMADNTEANVTLAQLEASKQNYVLRKGLLFKAYQDKKLAIENATTVAELEAL